MCICRSIVRGHRIRRRAGRVSTNVTGTQCIYFLLDLGSRSGFLSTEVSSGQTTFLDNLFHLCCQFGGLYALTDRISVLFQFGINLIPVLISGIYIIKILRTVLIQPVACRFTRHSATLPL